MSDHPIEDAICQKLMGEAREGALDLVAFMRQEGFSFEWFDLGNGGDIGWNPAHHGAGFGTIMVAPEWSQEGDGFILWLGPNCAFEDGDLADGDLKEFAWAHVVACPQAKYCKPPYCVNSENRWSIFGRPYESTCHAPLAFFNPDAKAFQNIKKLMSLMQIRRD